MVKLSELTNFLDDYLEVYEYEDKSWNGLQIEGAEDIEKVAFSVTAGGEIFGKILKWNPDLIFVHHGCFWKGQNPSPVGWKKERVSKLIKTDTSLYGCHLPLDQHKEVGNNVQLLQKIEAENLKEFTTYKGQSIGWMGEIAEKPVKEVVKKLEKKLDTDCNLLDFGPEKVKSVAVVTGSGGKHVWDAIEKNIDLLITGEETEITEDARDGGINVIFAGHYATETLGVKAVKDLLEDKFNLEGKFFNFPTGV